jgi:hypothetical protein
MVPDAGVVIVMQILVSALFIPSALVLVLLNINISDVMVPVIVTVLMTINSFFLFFSYFYLNAYILITAALIALTLFASRNAQLTLVGMFICLFALFWVSYSSGLGYLQHHSRFAGGNSINDTYEKYCDAYYRGYFFAPRIRKGYDDNPQVLYWSFCNRYWLAAVLFFMVLQELFLVLLVGAGALSLLLIYEDNRTEAHWGLPPIPPGRVAPADLAV